MSVKCPNTEIHSVALVGLGNIGSCAIPLLARLPGITDVALIDYDRYQTENLPYQDCLPAHAGRLKVQVQAQRLKKINGALRVSAWAEDIATVPLGRLRHHLILSAVDSMECRLAINRIAWRLGVPWIDTGIDPRSWLTRVTTYRPGRNHPCFECALDETDYASLPQRHLCAPDQSHRAPTHGPASLGALTAAFMTIEAAKILNGSWNRSLVGHQLVIDAQHHQHFLTSLRRHAGCRFDHQTWNPRPLGGLTVNDTIKALHAFARRAMPSHDRLSLQFEHRPFIRALHCPRCGRGRQKPVPQLKGPGTAKSCRRCGSALLAVGFTLLEALEFPLSRRWAEQSMCRLGLRPGDVFALRTRQGENHFEIQAKP